MKYYLFAPLLLLLISGCSAGKTEKDYSGEEYIKIREKCDMLSKNFKIVIRKYIRFSEGSYVCTVTYIYAEKSSKMVYTVDYNANENDIETVLKYIKHTK